MRKLSIEEMNRPDVETFRQLPKLHIIVLLNDIRSLLNTGSVFRTADAFLVEKMVLCGITGQPPHREIQKTALGATESVAWEYHKDALEAIDAYKEKGYRILCIEQTTQSVLLQEFDFSPEEKYLLILGNEVEGVSEELVAASETALEIPQQGTKHSLNVSVAAGIVLFQAYVQMLKR